MQQSFDRIKRQARELGGDPESLLAHSTPRLRGSAAAHSPDRIHLCRDRQADNSASCFDIAFNPQYENGASGSGQHSSSARQASSGSGAVTPSGDASLHMPGTREQAPGMVAINQAEQILREVAGAGNNKAIGWDWFGGDTDGDGAQGLKAG
ncbi:uncharacterized protein EAF01_001042 [Botrytis porri]|nr:uncharacterized protein EAF01_001042 [Botrytis porri]KAF7914636.1 hypothetical protein EAF01_001042 [Botrytis porri]